MREIEIATRIAELSRRRAAERFVGRDEQLGALTELLSPDPHALVAFVHGIAGIGKTSLLSAFALQAERLGAEVVELDCRTIEPTERGFLDELGSRLALAEPTLEGVLESLHGRPAPIVLTFDSYEVFRLLDTWLRQELVPALPAGVRVVCAGREAPLAAWLTAPDLDGVVRIVPLGPLADEESLHLFEELGVASASALRLNRVVRGHPLAIKLAAATVRGGGEPALEDVAAQGAVDTLAGIFLADVDPPTRAALEAASVVRRVTRSLLRAMLGAEEAEGAFETLAALPFVEPRADGLVIHDAVRGAIAAVLRGSDPELHRAFRRAAWRQLREEVREASQAELWRYTADMLYIIENPIVREAFFPSAMQPLAVESAGPADEPAIQRIARRHEGKEGARLIEAWWNEAPETFAVARDREGVVTAFFILLDNATMLPPAIAADPVVRQWVEHLRSERIPHGERVLGLRRWLDIDHGESPCASQAACWLDVKRTYMALRPNLRRIYVAVQDVPTYWPAVEKLGFRPVSDAAEVGEGAYTSVCLDFGPGSVDGWLAGLVAAELGLEPGIQLDQGAREVVIEGVRTSLAPLEFGVLQVLNDAGGRALSRRELLEAVWETNYTGGSNVVDAVVHSLRDKLGLHGAAVETVRGVGYRLRSPSANGR